MAVAIVGGVLAMLALSGGTSQVPTTPQGPPGLPTPFLGVAVLGSGGPAAAVDAYGSVVELRAPGPAGTALISTPYKRQRASSVDPTTGIVMRVSAGDDAPAPLSEGRPRQRYVRGGQVLETRLRQPAVSLRARDAMAPRQPLWAREVLIRRVPNGPDPKRVQFEISYNFDFGEGDRSGDSRRVKIGPGNSFTVRRGSSEVSCRQASRVDPELHLDGGVVTLRWSTDTSLRISLLCQLGGRSASVRPASESMHGGIDVETEVSRIHRAATREARNSLAAATALHAGAPAWANRLYRRSLLTLLALTDRATGAAPAALRDHWHYIWPRDAATVALALDQAGLDARAKAVANFILDLDAGHAARFNPDGSQVDDGRHEQGDSAGWAQLARRVAAGEGEFGDGSWDPGGTTADGSTTWRNQGDYGERDDDRGDYLANAIVAGASAEEIAAEFAHDGRLVREGVSSRDTDGVEPALDTAAAWAVRPFPRPALFPLVRTTLLELAATAGPYGLFPASDWRGRDPWTASTASTAWSLAALGERADALRLMRALKRAATPLDLLPERADIENGLPRSTTPLAWSHAFALLALQELWPPG